MEEEEWIDGMVEEWGAIFPNIPIFQFSSIPILVFVILNEFVTVLLCLLLIP